MTNFDPICRTIFIGEYNEGKIFCNVNFKDGRLSIHGVIGPLKNGNCSGSCGQIYDEIRNNLDNIEYAEKWDKVRAFEFVEMWKRWHLNDFHAGCEHQREYEKEEYSKHEGYRCDVCNYVYGSAWKKEKLPYMVWSYFYSLPETKTSQSWI